MKNIEQDIPENQPPRDFPAWIITGVVATLGAIDVLTDFSGILHHRPISGGFEALAFPMWAAWGMVRGHDKVIFDKIQHKLQK